MAILKKQPPLPQPVTIMPQPLKELLVWQAAARPFKKRNREYYTTVAAIIFLLAVILIFLQEWLLIGVIISLGFLAYVLSSVPPPQVENKITTKGVVIENKRYDWNLLYRFWFSQRWGSEILNIETRLSFPRRLMLLLGKTDKNKVQKILEKYLILEKPQKTFIDKAGLWLQKKFPLESE
jgi:hypothetical protein